MPAFSLADIISGDSAPGGSAGDLFKKTEKLQPKYDYTAVPLRNGASTNQDDDSDYDLLPTSKKDAKKREKKKKRLENKKKKIVEYEKRQDIEAGPLTIIGHQYPTDSVNEQDDLNDDLEDDLNDVLKDDLKENKDEPKEAQTSKKQTTQYNMNFIQKNPDNNIPEVKKLKKTNEPSEKDPEKEKRTVFVGNLPTDTKEKALKKMFSEFGKVECVRFRNLSRADCMKSLRYAAIKKDFHEKIKTINAYVRFSTEEEAEQSCQLNGSNFQNNIIRVDRALNRKHDHGKAVFLGNLSYTTHEDDMHAAFKKYGKIESVRLIRDAETRICKGFGYINFESEDGVEAVMALQPDSIEVDGRKIRISRSVRRPKKKRESDPDNKKFRKDKKPRTNTASFEEKMERKKEKFKALAMKKERTREKTKIHSFQGVGVDQTEKPANATKRKSRKLNRNELKKRSYAKKFA